MAISSNSSMGDENDGINDINITPLVDITLVLLIIMMIAAPTIYSNEKHLKMNLPASQGLDRPEMKKTPHFVELSFQNPNGSSLEIRLDGSIFDKATLKNRVQQIVSSPSGNESGQEFVIRADRNIRYEDFIDLAALLKSAGASKVAMASIESTSK